MLGGLWPLSQNFTSLHIDSTSSQKLFEVHKAGIQAGLTVVFIVKRGQKEAGNYRI